MGRAWAVLGVLLVVTALGFGSWWFFARDTTVPGLGACDPEPPEALVPAVVAELPHDADAFTQGLVVTEGELWESTGLRGESDLRQVDPATGEVLEQQALPPEQFGEGLAVRGDAGLVQLTWTSGWALVWDRDPLAQVASFDYEGEGWGLTAIGGERFAMSDGTDVLAVRNTDDFEVIERFTVARAGGEVGALNELDWDGEHLWANRYQTNEILRIDMDCGVVDAVVDASTLVERAAELAADVGLERDFAERDVLNGIASTGDGFYVTGKRWPVMFEVTFEPG